MNPDGSNQREVTSELVPVTAFDVSGDGATIAYSAGGIVKRMSVTGGEPPHPHRRPATSSTPRPSRPTGPA